MTLTQRFVRRYKAISSALAPPSTVWHRCPHCEQQTPWVVRALRGYYLCTACGRNPLEQSEHAQ
jgi:ribosomal protein L37AE/L43A